MAKISSLLVRSRLKLMMLAIIGFGPLIVAYVVFFYFPQWMPTSTTNRGELIYPPLVSGELASSDSLKGFWSLMLVQSECAPDCDQLRYLAAQVVKALGKDSNRVKNIVIARERFAVSQRQLSDTDFVTLDSYEMKELARISKRKPGLFLKDPNGNIIMFFPLEVAGKPMLRDLKHLLKLSNIG